MTIPRISYFEPALPFLLLLGLIGLADAWRSFARKRKPALLAISLAGILLLSMNVTTWLMSLPLEISYPHDPVPRESADAIVVLSGTVHAPTPNRPYTILAQDTYERLQHGVYLFKHWKTVPILVSGGSLNKHEAYALTMKRVLQSEGIPEDLIWVEDRSQSTHENAEFSSKILREHGIARIALVIEANSVLRATASFRKYGITVVPAPIRFSELDYSLRDILPDWRAIATNGETLHEYVGLLWYRLRGWI